VRDPPHLAKLLGEWLETVDPGLGVEAMTLWVPLAEPLAQEQLRTLGGPALPDLGVLVDRLSNRFGAARVYRMAPVESDVPERSEIPVAALGEASAMTWPPNLPRPIRLITPPQRVEALAEIPDRAPVAFTWRRIRHRIHRADGPERIFGEWWHRDAEMRAVRDYWAVEDMQGRRFWLYRRGDGTETITGDLSWFLHGLF
jgi:protein ImuB